MRITELMIELLKIYAKEWDIEVNKRYWLCPEYHPAHEVVEWIDRLVVDEVSKPSWKKWVKRIRTATAIIT